MKLSQLTKRQKKALHTLQLNWYRQPEHPRHSGTPFIYRLPCLVVIDNACAAPEARGSAHTKFTARFRSGYSRTVFIPSTRRIAVSEQWLALHM
jgi:hypothetical protein